MMNQLHSRRRVLGEVYDGFFRITVKTDNAGTSNDTSFTLPISGNSNSYDVDWNNDGTFTDTEIAGEITHDYGTAGTYTIANLLVVTMI